ncbi:hypothetical protein WMY93_032282 [Mugilogobius chulae]|uniref:Phosphatase 2A Regulatory Subunit A helical domain-containing protein n=1 Tax=Mugilogobius chulae TaxID=88201 RepID=A0AAW0MW31_9GOBI
MRKEHPGADVTGMPIHKVENIAHLAESALRFLELVQENHVNNCEQDVNEDSEALQQRHNYDSGTTHTHSCSRDTTTTQVQHTHTPAAETQLRLRYNTHTLLQQRHNYDSGKTHTHSCSRDTTTTQVKHTHSCSRDTTTTQVKHTHSCSRDTTTTQVQHTHSCSRDTTTTQQRHNYDSGKTHTLLQQRHNYDSGTTHTLLQQRHNYDSGKTHTHSCSRDTTTTQQRHNYDSGTTHTHSCSRDTTTTQQRHNYDSGTTHTHSCSRDTTTTQVKHTHTPAAETQLRLRYNTHTPAAETQLRLRYNTHTLLQQRHNYDSGKNTHTHTLLQQRHNYDSGKTHTHSCSRDTTTTQLEALCAHKREPLMTSVKADWCSGGETELQALHEMVQQKVVTLLSDPENMVKHSLMDTGITRLCVFFGRQKANDVLLSHMITFLNDKTDWHLRGRSSTPSWTKTDWHLRGAFFDSIVGVAAYVGWQSSSILKPLLQQGLSDTEEFVIYKALEALTCMCDLGLLQKAHINEFVSDIAAGYALTNTHSSRKHTYKHSHRALTCMCGLGLLQKAHINEFVSDIGEKTHSQQQDTHPQ